MSTFIQRLRDRAAGVGRMIPRKKLPEKTRRTIITHRFDEATWDKVRKVEVIDSFIDDLVIGDTHHGGTRSSYESGPDLVHDLFMAFYKPGARLEDERNTLPEVHLNYRIVRELLSSPEYQDWQRMVEGDPVRALIAVSGTADYIREILGRVPPPPPPPEPKPEPQEGKGGGDEGGGEGSEANDPGQKGDGSGSQPGQGDQPGDQGDPGDQPGEQPGQGDQPGDGEGDEDGETPEEQAEREWREEYDKLLDDVDISTAMAKAVGDAEEGVDEVETLRAAAGCENGEWQSTDPTQRLQWAEKLRTPYLKILVDIVGRTKRYALGCKARRINDVPQQPWNVSIGNDLERLIEPEFAMLALDDTELDFFRRFAQAELLLYKLRGSENAGKGPIVVCIDKSTSMNGRHGTPVGQRPFTWAIAVAEALRRFAADENRDYFAILFGQNHDRHRFDFPKGKGPFEKVLTFLSAEANGGTAFDGVLTEALEKASTAFDGENRGKADIVFITDGQAPLSEDWIVGFNAERQRVGVRLYSIFIGGADDMERRTVPVRLLERISDLVIPVTELRPEEAEHIFTHV